jgi:hypothetical protein
MLKRQALFYNIFPLLAILCGCMLNDLQETPTSSKPDIYISSTVPDGNGGTLDCGVQMCSTPGFFCQTDFSQTIKITITRPAPEATNRFDAFIFFYQRGVASDESSRNQILPVATWRCPFYPDRKAYVSQGKLSDCLMLYPRRQFHFGNIGVGAYVAVSGPTFGPQHFENSKAAQILLTNTTGRCY